MKKLLLALCLCAALHSCSEQAIENLEPTEVKKITAFVEELEWEEGIATKATIQKSNLSFYWEDTDEVGIFPNLGGYQLGFSMEGQGGQGLAQFDGGGWALRTDAKYSCYYPFNFDLRNASAIPVDFSEQSQTGNGSIDHLGDYTFCATGTPCDATDGVVTFAMNRVNGTIWFVITVPEPGVYTKITLETDAPLFTIKGTYNLAASQSQDDLVVTPVLQAKTQTLALNDITISSDNLTINAYMTSAPFDLTGHTFYLTVLKSDGSLYKADIANPILRRNQARRIAVTVTPVNGQAGWEDGENINMGI